MKVDLSSAGFKKQNPAAAAVRKQKRWESHKHVLCQLAEKDADFSGQVRLCLRESSDAAPAGFKSTYTCHMLAK
eukprot:5702012-Amphidinium_carterae.2